MKRMLTLITLVFVTLTVLTAQTKQKAESKGSDAKVESVVINVPTVVCSSCVSTITKALKKVEGVKTTKIDLKKKTATVVFAAAKTSLKHIEKAIANAGYDANDTKRDPAAYEKLDACCKLDSKE
jgi:periplasmic mercuric ion binding protein